MINAFRFTVPISFTTTSLIIDDADVGWTTSFLTQDWDLYTGNSVISGYNVNFHSSASADLVSPTPLAGNEYRTATWTFTGLSAGSYDVAVTWNSYQPLNRASNTPLSCTTATQQFVTTIDQRTEPLADYMFEHPSNTPWGKEPFQTIFTGVSVTNGVIDITMSNAADNYVIADAVYVERIPPFEFDFALRSNNTDAILPVYITDPLPGALQMNRDASTIIVADGSNDEVTTDAGKAAVFDWTGTTWVQRGSAFFGLGYGDRLGGYSVRSNSIAIDGAGDTIVIGTPLIDAGGFSQNGEVRVYEWSGSTWAQKGNALSGSADQQTLGSYVDISFDGNTILVAGAQFFGSQAYPEVYEWSGSAWVQKGSSIPINMQGSSQSKAKLSPDGNIVAASNSLADSPASNAGEVEIYEWSGTAWVQKGQTLTGYSTEDRYHLVSINEDATRMVTSYDNGSSERGFVEVYNWNGASWTQIQTMSGEDVDDRFGEHGAMTRDGRWLILTAIAAGPTDAGQLYVYKYNASNTQFELVKTIDYVENSMDNIWGRDDATLTYDENIFKLQYNAEHPMFDITFGSVPFNWTQIGSTINGSTNEYLGWSTDLNYAGDILAVGVPGLTAAPSSSGGARVYENIAGSWSQIGSDINGTWPDGGYYGTEVSINSAGNILVMSSNGGYDAGSTSNRRGYVDVYENIGGTWTPIHDALSGDENNGRFGNSVDINATGDVIAVGAFLQNGPVAGQADGGAVYIYENTGSAWTQVGSTIYSETSALIDASYFAEADYWGKSVALNAAGDRFVAGAYYNDDLSFPSLTAVGHARVFELSGGDWVQVGADMDGDQSYDFFGYSVSMNATGNIIAAAAVNGYVRVYEDISGTWTQIGSDITSDAASNQGFGYSVKLNSTGDILAIGEYSYDGNGTDAGRVVVYRNYAGNWIQVGPDLNGSGAGERAGRSVSLDETGDIVAFGNWTSNGAASVYNLTPS